jgi:hypothetical protein
MSALNPHTKKPYSRGSQPYVIHRWLDGLTEPGVSRPSRNYPWQGVMMAPDTKTVECRKDRLFSYGEMVARRGARDTIEVMMALSSYAPATVARRIAREALRRGFEVVIIGPNGTPKQAAEMRLACAEKMLRRMKHREEWSSCWRLQHIAQEVKAVAETGLIDHDRLNTSITAIKAKVTWGRMQGWAENRCQDTLQKVQAAQHAIECFAVAA